MRRCCCAIIGRLDELQSAHERHAAGQLARWRAPPIRIDRQMTARCSALTASPHNSLDGVADRDFCVELAAALSL